MKIFLTASIVAVSLAWPAGTVAAQSGYRQQSANNSNSQIYRSRVQQRKTQQDGTALNSVYSSQNTMNSYNRAEQNKKNTINRLSPPCKNCRI